MSGQGKLLGGVSVAGLIILLSSCAGETDVALVNRTAKPLQRVSVEFTGGVTRPLEIRAGGDAIVALNPTGESSLTVLYQSSAGLQKCWIDTYLEPGYRAEFRIELYESTCRATRKQVESYP